MLWLLNPSSAVFVKENLFVIGTDGSGRSRVEDEAKRQTEDVKQQLAQEQQKLAEEKKKVVELEEKLKKKTSVESKYEVCMLAKRLQYIERNLNS